jgi:hypothetical protein
MRTETLSLVISGDGKMLGNELGRQERRVNTFAGKVGGMFAGMGKRIGGAVGRLANPLALIGGTAGVMMAARDLIQYQDSISSLGISAGLSAGQMMELEKRIQSAAYATGQSRESLVSAVKEMAELTGDNDFAASALEDVGRAATAVSADITTTAQAFAAFRRDMGATNEQAAALFNTMAAMGNVRSMDRFARSAQVLGLTMDNFAGYNALIKTLAPTMGGVDNAANAVDQIATTLKTHKSGQLRHMFRDAIDSKGTITDYKKLLEAISGMTERTRKAVFSKAGASLVSFDVNKITADFNRYIEKAENAKHVTDGFARKQGEAKYQINALTTAAKEFAGVALSPVLADLTAHFNALISNPAKMREFNNNLTNMASALGDIATIVGPLAKVGAILASGTAQGINITKEGMEGWKQDYANRKNTPKPATKRQLSREYYANKEDFFVKYDINKTELEQRAKRITSDPGVINMHIARMAQQEAARRLGQPATAAVQPPEVKNNIVINQQITESGRVITEVNNPNTSITTNMRRGQF